jgi:hypothetical protein
MFKCTLRDLFWLLLLSAVGSGWYAHARAMHEGHKAMEQEIAVEYQQYYDIEAKYNKLQERQTQELKALSPEKFEAYDMNLVAQNQYSAVRQRLTALGVALPKQLPGRSTNANLADLTLEEEKDLEQAKKEYRVLWETKFGLRP